MSFYDEDEDNRRIYDRNYDDIEETYDDENDENYNSNNIDVNIEDYVIEPDTTDTPYMEDEQVFVQQRILPGQEDQIQNSRQLIYGLQATTAEGAIGKVMRRGAFATRTPLERMGDTITKISNESYISDYVRDSTLELLLKIPDIAYKSAAGLILGFMFYPYIGRKLNKNEKTKFNEILDKAEVMRNRSKVKISDLDIIRYAKFIKNIINTK
jgi:hypothetical protein